MTNSLIRDILLGLRQPVANFFHWIVEFERKRDLFRFRLRRYRRNAFEVYKNVKALGMSKPMDIRNLYVQIRIIDKTSKSIYMSPSKLSSYYDWDKRKVSFDRQTYEGLAIVNEHNCLTIFGKPGSGKTVFLKYLLLQSVLGKIKSAKLPIFISLKEFAFKEGLLWDFIIEQLKLFRYSEDPADQLSYFLSKGKVILLLDGIDEISNKTRKLKLHGQINQLIKSNPGNKVIISSRTGGIEHFQELFTDVEIADFKEPQVFRFINNWFGDNQKISEELISEIKEHREIFELAQIPVLLTLICLTYSKLSEAGEKLPKRKAQLYSKAIEVLLTSWDAQKNVVRDKTYLDLSIQQKETLFANTAYYFFTKRNVKKENSFLFTKSDLLSKIQEIYQNQFNKDSETSYESILNSIEVNHGIFVIQAEDIYSFNHLSIQEYFTAFYLSKNYSVELYEDIVKSHLFDHKWKEVFALLAGLVPILSQLTAKIHQISHSLVKSEFYQQEFHIPLVRICHDFPQKCSRFADNKTNEEKREFYKNFHELKEYKMRVIGFWFVFSRSSLSDDVTICQSLAEMGDLLEIDFSFKTEDYVEFIFGTKYHNSFNYLFELRESKTTIHYIAASLIFVKCVLSKYDLENAESMDLFKSLLLPKVY